MVILWAFQRLTATRTKPSSYFVDCCYSRMFASYFWKRDHCCQSSCFSCHKFGGLVHLTHLGSLHHFLLKRSCTLRLCQTFYRVMMVIQVDWTYSCCFWHQEFIRFSIIFIKFCQSSPRSPASSLTLSNLFPSTIKDTFCSEFSKRSGWLKYNPLYIGAEAAYGEVDSELVWPQFSMNSFSQMSSYSSDLLGSNWLRS